MLRPSKVIRLAPAAEPRVRLEERLTRKTGFRLIVPTADGGQQVH
jgi:hypothetical protein